jgi:hypothetical protein
VLHNPIKLTIKITITLHRIFTFPSLPETSDFSHIHRGSFWGLMNKEESLDVCRSEHLSLSLSEIDSENR